jgi:hypothetical protein
LEPVISLAIAAIIGLLPAFIAWKKGRNFMLRHGYVGSANLR